MAKTRRNATAALVAVMTLAVAGHAHADENSKVVGDQLETTIILHVANHAALGPDMLAVARNRVADVYEMIGVRMEWDDRGLSVPGRRDGALHLNVLILSRDLREKEIAAVGERNKVLGYAHLPTRRAYIFPNRIAELTAPATYLAERLGDVIAHEVGHLLMGTKSHSTNGIMRASLDVHAVVVQRFSGTEARAIHAALITTE